MFTNKQSRGSLWMGVAAVLAMTSAVAAQFQGSSVQNGSGAPQSGSVTAGSVAVSSSDTALIDVDWINLGYELAGANGAPKFKGMGTIAPGIRSELILKGAAPDSLAVLFVSLDSAPRPFKGGVLVPAAPTYTTVLMTDSQGGITIGVSASVNVPAGFDLVMQYAIADEGAPQGVALSNALQTSTH